MKVLLAIDGSPFSAPPTRAVVSRPWPPGSVVRILSVFEMPVVAPAPDVVLAATLGETQEALRKEAEKIVESARETVAQSQLPVETLIRAGGPGPEIVDEAKEWAADLILLGSHGRTGLKRVLLGSVAQYVVSHAPCSVEVVRAKPPKA